MNKKTLKFSDKMAQKFGEDYSQVYKNLQQSTIPPMKKKNTKKPYNSTINCMKKYVSYDRIM